MKRRSFLKNSGFIAAGAGLGKFIPVAGPFSTADYSGLKAPADKKLRKEWVQSLYERGATTTYSKLKDEIKYIGMPVGGICCGTVYLGGDGRLWLWDIFNRNQLGAVNKVLPIKLEVFNVDEINNIFGSLYVEPALDVRPLKQGLALIIRHGGSTIVKRLHEADWDDIHFEATYPVATIKYIDKRLPVEVSLQAFSPFIPGDEMNSGLPVTIQSLSVRNISTGSVTVEVAGWLENKILLNTATQKKDFSRINRPVENPDGKGVLLDCEVTDKELMKAPDFGNMAFISPGKSAAIFTDISEDDNEVIKELRPFIKPLPASPVAMITSRHELKPDQQLKEDFIISWYTPNVCFPNSGNNQEATVQGADFHYYTNHFADAAAVANYVAEHYTMLKGQTMLWMMTWYDSTLPWWFLERTLMNISTLATTTSHRFKSGRFYAWEGVGCCHGTCTHVYQYAQAMSRIFPALERDTRERVDLGISFHEDTGQINIRGEQTGPSIDGQAGTLLRFYREYLMSADGALLKNNWEKIKKAVVFVMKQDKNRDGMEDTPMENTLDALWSGEISWIVGLCIAGVLAGQRMAEEMNDEAFAAECRDYVEKGRKNMEQYLFNGEYFIHRPDPAVGKQGVGSYNTCHIDQVYGQSWAWQAGLGRILDKEKTMSALRALWKYNYMPDVGPYIKEHTGGRFYALAGEGGMVMNTNPMHDDKPYGEAKAWQIGYFSECMSGFEYQVAGHMMAEGMIEESLVLTRSVHDRYHAQKRNPFNEIECSDHYARAMASFGVFISACGYTYHGPKGYIGFAPKISPEKFKAPFTAAAGWGSFSQERNEKAFAGRLELLHGELKIEKISVELDKAHQASAVQLKYRDKLIDGKFSQSGQQCDILLRAPLVLQQGEVLTFQLS